MDLHNRALSSRAFLARSFQAVAPRLRMIGLALLVAATGFAVGATTSFWLVPVYLLVMGWLLVGFPSAKASSLPAAAPANDFAAPADTPDVSSPSEEVSAPAAEPPAKRAAKPRARGTRAPRTKPKPEPEAPRLMATWVQVAPGKFVRVEVPQTLESSKPDSAISELEVALAHIVPEVSPDEASNGDTSESREDPDRAVEPVFAEAPVADASSESLDSSCHAHDQTFSTSVVTEEIANPPVPEAEAMHMSIVEPRPSRIVAKIRGNAFGVLRSSRMKGDPRAMVRRPAGRIGAIPRVMLHRS